MQQLTRTVARNSLSGLAAQVTIKLLSFGFYVVIVRHLGAESFGQYSAVLAFGTVFVFFGDLGLSPYTVREVARQRDVIGGPERIRLLFGNLIALRFVLSLVAVLAMILAAWLTQRPPAMLVGIALGALGLLIYAPQGACDALLAGHERLDLSAGAKVLNQLTFVVIGAVMLWLGFGYYGLMMANLIGIALMAYACWRAVSKLRVSPLAPSIADWGGLLRAGLPFGIIGFTLGLSYRFDSVLLNIFRGDAETGYYSAAYNLVFTAAIISNVLNTSLYPTLIRQAANSPERLPRIYDRVLRLLVLLALPIAVGTWVLAEPLITVLFTGSYVASVPALRIAIWVVPLMFLSEFLGYIVVIQGQERRVARAVLVSTGVNVALNLVLVPTLGYMAAAAMTVLTEAVLVGQYVWMLRTLLARFDWWQVVLRTATAAGLMGVVVSSFPDWSLIGRVLVGMLSYAGLVLVLGLLKKEEVTSLWRLRTGPVVPPPVAMPEGGSRLERA